MNEYHRFIKFLASTKDLRVLTYSLIPARPVSSLFAATGYRVVQGSVRDAIVRSTPVISLFCF